MATDGSNFAGYDATMKALHQYDDVQYKLIQERIITAAKRIQTKARDNIQSAASLANWGTWTSTRDGRDLSFDPEAAAGSVRVTKGSGKIKRQRGRFVTNAIGVVTSDPVAQIFHTMGNAKKPGPRTSALGESMRGNFASIVPTPRGLWAASDSEGPSALADIAAAVHDAEAITNRVTH